MTRRSRSAATVILVCGPHSILALVSTVPIGADAEAGAWGPRFVVDPSWPLEMPNNWILGAVTGVFVDAGITSG